MKTKEINQHQALRKLRAGESISEFKVVFDHRKVEALDAIILGKNKIKVPENLIFYNDKTIDFSDDPDITDQDFANGKLVWNIKTTLPVDKELKDWISREQVDVDKLLLKLMRDFYETVKDLPQKAAF